MPRDKLLELLLGRGVGVPEDLHMQDVAPKLQHPGLFRPRVFPRLSPGVAESAMQSEDLTGEEYFQFLDYLRREASNPVSAESLSRFGPQAETLMISSAINQMKIDKRARASIRERNLETETLKDISKEQFRLRDKL